MSINFDHSPNHRLPACRSLCRKMSCLECCCATDQANTYPTNSCKFCKLVQNLNPEKILLETQSAVVVRSEVPQGQIHLLVIPRLHLDGKVLGVFGADDVPLLRELGLAGQKVLFDEAGRLGLYDYYPVYVFHRRPGKHMILNVVVNPVKIEDYFPDPSTGEYRDNVILLDDLIRSLYSPSV